MGPAERVARTYNKFVGWGRRIRTPATWSRATRPTTRRSPTNAPTLPHPDLPHPDSAHASGARLNRQSADRGLEGAARAETRNFNSRNLDLRAGAGVAAVARGPARHHERPKTGNCYTPAAAQGFHDAPDHRVHRAFCGGFRTSRVLGHDGHELGLRHPALRPSLSSAAGTTVSMTEDGERATSRQGVALTRTASARSRRGGSHRAAAWARTVSR